MQDARTEGPVSCHAPAGDGVEGPADDAALTDTDRRIVARLRSIEGHVRGIERMVRDGTYCMDVVHQILAVQRALQKVNTAVLDRHLHACATAAIRGDDPDERERVLHELVDVFAKAGR